jgi:hypothetical protein
MVKQQINDFIMEENKSNSEDLDYVMRLSYKSLISDTRKTLKEFIVFTDGDEIVELKGGTGEKIQYIDTLIKYFEDTEEFEKCKDLLDLKHMVEESIK